MESKGSNIYRIEFYGDGLEFASENESHKVLFGDLEKEFDNFSSAKEFYDLLIEAELVETKYNSVLEGKKRIKIDQTKRRIIDFGIENHNLILLANEELTDKLNEISSGVGMVIIYGSILEHYLGDYIATNFSDTRGQYERTQLFISELSFAQKCNIVIKEMKGYVHYGYRDIFAFMSADERQSVINENEFLKKVEEKINALQKSLEQARIVRNNYAHAQYDYFFKGDLISISTKSNNRTGVIERCVKYFTDEDIAEDFSEILSAIDGVDEVKDLIDEYSHKFRK